MKIRRQTDHDLAWKLNDLVVHDPEKLKSNLVFGNEVIRAIQITLINLRARNEFFPGL